MADIYSSFAELKRHALARDFAIVCQKRNSSWVAAAPHGGGIEPGTSEIAEAIAGLDHSFYTFKGMRRSDNADLHITSTFFDEPRCLKLLAASEKSLVIHGEGSKDAIVFIGGTDQTAIKKIKDALNKAGFKTACHSNHKLQGEAAANICNKTKSGQGVQLELSEGLRKSFFKALSKPGRRHRTPAFDRFVMVVRKTLDV